MLIYGGRNDTLYNQKGDDNINTKGIYDGIALNDIFLFHLETR